MHSKYKLYIRFILNTELLFAATFLLYIQYKPFIQFILNIQYYITALAQGFHTK
jgi:hypothetical protein